MTTTTRRRGQVPQPAAAPPQDKEAEAAAKKAEREQAEQEWRDLINAATGATGKFEAASDQIKRAIELELALAAARKDVNDNREYLRLMSRNKAVNEDQQEFLDVWYPSKERGDRRDREDIEATRKLKLVVHKDGNAEEDDES